MSVATTVYSVTVNQAVMRQKREREREIGLDNIHSVVIIIIIVGS